jgi:hypothetical protein
MFTFIFKKLDKKCVFLTVKLHIICLLFFLVIKNVFVIEKLGFKNLNPKNLESNHFPSKNIKKKKHLMNLHYLDFNNKIYFN